VSARGAAERGYALIMAAVAALALAVIAAIVTYSAASVAMGSVYEAAQAEASSVAAAGLEWGVATRQSGTQSFGGGTFTVAIGPGRLVTSTGVSGMATRVAVCELSLVYVPSSRWASNGSSVAFEVYNDTGADESVTGLTATLASAGYYETVTMSIFADVNSGVSAVDYGTIWSYATDGGGARAGSGAAIAFASPPVVPAGGQALVTLTGFNTAPTGGSPIGMDTQEVRVVFMDASGPLAATAVPRITP
jgi:hypothetical protein